MANYHRSLCFVFLGWSILATTQCVAVQGNPQSPAPSVCVFSPEVLSEEIAKARTFTLLVHPFMMLVRIALYCAERINFTDIANDSLTNSERLHSRLLSTPDYVQSAWFYHLLRAYDTLTHPKIGRVHDHLSRCTNWRQFRKSFDQEGQYLLARHVSDAVDALVYFLGDLGMNACHGALVSNELRPVMYVQQVLLQATAELNDLVKITNMFIDESKKKRKNIAFLYAFILTTYRDDFNTLLGGDRARYINPRRREYVSLQMYTQDYWFAPFAHTFLGTFGLLEAVFIVNPSCSS